MEIKQVSIESLIPYARNARTHDDAQVAQIAASIREFGFTNPLLLDDQNGVIAGHGRLMAARKLGMASVPCIYLSHLSETQKRAYIIADNKLALNAGWDEEMLAVELQELGDLGFDLDLTGFADFEIKDLFSEEGDGGDDSPYTKKIEAPKYEITGKTPEVGELYISEKTEQLEDEIKNADIPDDIRDFLLKAAQRHTIFDFSKIAEFYAAADPVVQILMERSALVIIDFDKAIEGGFVRMSEAIMRQYSEDYSDDA